MKRRVVGIHNVLPESIAQEAGIEQGDGIISINGEKIKDIFDYRFLIADENIVIEIQKKDGEVWEIDIEKEENEDLGIEFEHSLIDEAKRCTNKCIFCFMDQMPSGMRDTLYFKDDDMRLSFLMGNYVTLTNVSFEDINRIIRYRMSPINVSVHTTNPELRIFMLNNRFAGDVMHKIKQLTDADIEVNCQIVLCRGVNDGNELDKTISDLSSLYPGVKSVSVVPVGLTKYREGLHSLVPYDAQASKEVITQVENWQEKLIEKQGSRVVYLADEFYIMAGLQLPEYEHYEDFPQIENGVGLVSLLRYEFDEYIETVENVPSTPREISIATGVLAYKYIKEMAQVLQKKFNNIRVNVYEIKNNFFGENVTVTGLIIGRDIASQLKGKNLGEELLICRCMLKSDEDIFLDDITPDMLGKQLNVAICIVENSGKDFVDKILGKNS